MVLIGMMGSGKTTVGRLLAERTGWTYHDNDSLFQAATSETARSILARSGVSELRSAEADALRRGLEMAEPCFIGAAAGTIMDAELRAAIAEKAIVVWLAVSPEELARRAVGADHRPWLDADAVGWMRETLAFRWPLFESVADLVVDADRDSPEQAVDEILAWLAERCDVARLPRVHH